MSTFRKFSSKVKKSSTTGSGSYEVYKTEWFAYDKMAAFLHTVYAARGTTTSERPKNDDTPDEDNIPIHIEDDTSATINNEGDSSTATGPNHSDSNVTEPEPKGGLPLWKKRKANNALIEKRMDQAYNFLQEVVTKPKNKKGEVQLFCNLLCTKLEALDERKRDIVMHEINMLMYNAKNTCVQPNAIPTQNFCPQPQNFRIFTPLGITPNQYQPSSLGSNENSQSFVSPAPTPSPSTSSSAQCNQNVTPLSSDTEHSSIAELFATFNSGHQ